MDKELKDLLLFADIEKLRQMGLSDTEIQESANEIGKAEESTGIPLWRLLVSDIEF